MRNGGLIGVRNTPKFDGRASGAWHVDEAYHADRDGIWPRWPKDAGLVLDDGLLYWLEADYGLYQDEAATIPAIAEGDPVRAWVNRGNAGIVRFEPAQPAMTLRLNAGKPWLNLNFALSQVQPVSMKSFTYVFVKSTLDTSTNFRLFSEHDLANGQTPASGSRMNLTSGGSLILPTSASNAVTISGGTSALKSGALSLIARTPLAYLVGATSYYSLMVNYTSDQVTSLQGQVSGVVPASPTFGFNTGMRAIGQKLSTGAIAAANGKIKALVMYSTDTPLTQAQLHAMAKYLGDKWGYSAGTGFN